MDGHIQRKRFGELTCVKVPIFNWNENENKDRGVYSNDALPNFYFKCSYKLDLLVCEAFSETHVVFSGP